MRFGIGGWSLGERAAGKCAEDKRGKGKSKIHFDWRLLFEGIVAVKSIGWERSVGVRRGMLIL